MLTICFQGTYPFPLEKGVVPGSDGAGVVIAIGERVTRFKEGDKVCTTLNQGHLAGSLNPQILQTSLGGSLDGTLRQYGVFEESGLVHMPKTLSFNEASTLPCAAVTAWNVLYGLQGRPLKPGDTVLTQGTGGVSTFALQFAVAAGATVIATTSSAEKEKKLRSLGAHHVINYKTDTKWGETAKKLTPGGEGVDFVVEVGGATTLKQSIAAIRIDGIITIVGAIGGQPGGQQEPGLLEAWYSTCTVRGVAVGSRAQFEEMNRAIEANGLKPVLDEKVFKLEQLKDACQRMWDQKNSGKVVIKCH
jgi:NADPH:quinone reductase-like Zn-dependent oxidoreductase